MGTVVMVCMFVTILFANRIPGISLNRVSPLALLRVVGVITGAAGLWNVLWYGLRHIGEFWGHMALGSGVLMTLLSALLILAPARQPPLLNTLRPVAIVGLLGFAITYAVKIYSL
jgi:hypothetical protein